MCIIIVVSFYSLTDTFFPTGGFAFSVPAWSQPGTRRESIEVNKSSKLSCFLCCSKDTKGGGKIKKALKCIKAKECWPSRFKVATDFQNLAWKGGIGEGEDLWINYTVDLSAKISELSGGQSHMLRINGSSGPLILHPLFSALDKLDFGDGKVARPFVSLDRFGAIHYAAGWGKVSMWPDRPVSPLCTAAGRDQLSHTHTVHCKLRTAPLSSYPTSHLTAQHHLCAHTHTHPLYQHTLANLERSGRGCVCGVGGRYLARTITRKAGEQNATASLWGRI